MFFDRFASGLEVNDVDSLAISSSSWSIALGDKNVDIGYRGR